MLTTAWVDGVKISIDDYKKGDSKEAFCSLSHRLMPKKGKKVVHHFAHYPNSKCDAWHGQMTYWHAQWQKIVADKANLEVCLDANGKILGHSAFNGASAYANIVATKLDGHIADIIRPSDNPNSRPLIVEIQHSSMSKETIDAREAYYQHMVWLFDFTPRMTTVDKCNKIVFTDGKINYLKEKVTYVAMLSCANYHAAISYPTQQSNGQTANDNAAKVAASPHSGLLIPATSFDQTETRQSLFGLPITSAASTNSSGGNNNNLPAQTFSMSSIVNTASLTKPCRGDECFNDTLTPTTGFFMIVNTRTRHWFDTTKPTYFDTGFCILRMLLPLNGSFVLTLYMSYEEFIIERMPAVNPEKIAKADWFKTINPAILIKLGMIPKIIDVQGINICRNRIIVNHKTCELADVGFSQGLNQWHAGSFYATQAASTTTVMPTSVVPRTVNVDRLPGGSSNDDMLLQMMTQATSGVTVKFNNTGTSALAGELLIITKLRRFLGLSSSTEVTIVNKRSIDHLVVYCTKETLGMKDKFKTLEMKYYKGTNDVFSGGKKISGKQAIKQTRGAIQSSVLNATSGVLKVDKLKKDHSDAFQKEERANWYAKVSLIETKLANL